ncbi:MAG: c-type cytochrome [Candidatus Tectomicrobia bacterium]|nr:c-type cytochrome [Candidatus Tectomicrobia bacterium]MBI3025409.1 c-type cytochrome [Candidatus Tectomicrobia bacterium]
MTGRYIHRRRVWLAGGALAAAALATGAAFFQVRWAGAQQPHGGPAPAAGEEAPIRMTMEELHRQGGVPKGWRFLLPKGDAPAGREVFVKMECYSCHVVKGEKFPTSSSREPGKGTELTGIGGAHPPEYFFEALLNPNRVIIQGPGYSDKQGLSTMPNYNDVMTLEEAVNLVAYLKSLTGPEEGHPAAPKDQKEAPQGGGPGGGMKH